MDSRRGGGGGAVTAVHPGVGQCLGVLRIMQPKVGQGVCGRLGAGEEYSVQTPWPVWPSILLVSMKNVAPVTWLLSLKFKRRKTNAEGPCWLPHT